MRLNISIDAVLNVWVRRWASKRECRGYPSLVGFSRESPRIISHYSIDELDEDSYLKIDYAVDMLRQTDLEAYQVLMALMLQGHDKREICTVMRIAPRTFDNRLKTARDFMTGAVFGGGVFRVWL
ncbi:antitermination protein [Pasteurellaceae bacterium 15-036681]|nr:antitermination protein [Pasteurellaceae bacterium 15-036681]